MQELWLECIKAVNLPYSILFGATLTYWILYLVGALGSDFLDFMDFDTDVDVDPDVDVDADIIATACPLCHANLDVFQKQIKDEYSEVFDMPVVYFTQLMGVAYGLDAKTLGMDKHFTDSIGLLKEKGLLVA